MNVQTPPFICTFISSKLLFNVLYTTWAISRVLCAHHTFTKGIYLIWMSMSYEIITTTFYKMCMEWAYKLVVEQWCV
jgi:hypothetical protein